MKNKIRLYRFFGATHYKGGLFPEYADSNIDWTTSREEAETAYRSCSIKNFDKYKIEEAKFENQFSEGDEFCFLWLMLETCEVDKSAWQAHRTWKGEYAEDFIGNNCDWNFETIEERGMYFNGRNMSKKKFDSIIYSDHVKPEYVTV